MRIRFFFFILLVEIFFRFMVGQYITINDDVITHLNISSVEEEDGGEYACTAKNSISQVSYSARINVYGERN